MKSSRTQIKRKRAYQKSSASLHALAKLIQHKNKADPDRKIAIGLRKILLSSLVEVRKQNYNHSKFLDDNEVIIITENNLFNNIRERHAIYHAQYIMRCDERAKVNKKDVQAEKRNERLARRSNNQAGIIDLSEEN